MLKILRMNKMKICHIFLLKNKVKEIIKIRIEEL
jgi:hypothetical protein